MLVLQNYTVIESIISKGDVISAIPNVEHAYEKVQKYMLPQGIDIEKLLKMKISIKQILKMASEVEIFAINLKII